MDEENNLVENQEEQSTSFKYAIGVSFKKALQVYYFGTNDENLKDNTPVVVETSRGLELGTTNGNLKLVENLALKTELKPIIRIATNEDLKNAKENEEAAIKTQEICLQSINELKLGMHLISSEYTLDATKVIFTYVADERVDFRELLKVLAQKLHFRIELRQIGARDRSKSVGGLGPCGLPLCCSSFLTDFEGISINMAKNQLLALNIAKLSGQCGKLVCCLKYENELYSELKKGLPKLGQKVIYNDVEYKITSMNVLSRTMKLDNKENSLFITIDEFLESRKQ